MTAPGSEQGGRAQIVGTGLIGASIGAALRERGWTVTGSDRDRVVADAALAQGALDAVGTDVDAEITFVATPVGAIEGAVRAALAAGRGLVTDVGSVKSPLLELMADPRYVGGHPMAGSEQDGVAGADPGLFEGATWVLTPVPFTDDAALSRIRFVVTSLGAEVVALRPEDHDRIVAVVSHVPHLTAGALMRLADERSGEHRAVLRLAAGGFRDMTRVAAGHPGIWPDICAENADAIVAGLDDLVAELAAVRAAISSGDRSALTTQLESARRARRNLPERVAHLEELAELRVPIPDEAGALARVLTIAGEHDVSVADVEVVHSTEGGAGVAVLLVEQRPGELLRDALDEAGHRASLRSLT
jgi:prephenate dehydrogenase